MTHPDRNTLRAYLLGQLPDESSSVVASHVDTCLNCETMLASLDREADALVSQLAIPAVPSEFTDESELTRVLDRAKQLVPVAASPAVSRPSLARLGRLREYELLEKLGQGGMGAVYKARHVRLNKIVAVKVLPSDRMSTPAAVARFEREMLAVGSLDHPNLIRAHDAGEVDGTHFLVMEYVAGVDLSAIVKQHGRLGVADACELVRQTAVGLQYAHEHGLVHRDIKPSNLMLTRDGQVKVLDLGLALLQDPATANSGGELTGTGQIMGTVDYMAPEQVGDSHTVDIRADIYSLGATLYKLLVGVAPFAGNPNDPLIHKLVALATKPHVPLSQHCPQAPAALARLVDGLLAKQPADRTATPAEVATALAPLAAGHEITKLFDDTAVRSSSGQPDTHSHLSAPGTGTHADGLPKSELSLTRSFQPQSLPVQPPRRPRRKLLLAAAAGSMLIAFAVWVIFKDDKGNEVARVKVPEGGTATMQMPAARVDSPAANPSLPLPTTATHSIWPPGPSDNVLPGLVSRPAQLPGVRRWNVETIAPRAVILSLAWSADSRRLAVASGEGSLRIYNIDNDGVLTLLSRFAFATGFAGGTLAWHPTGEQIAYSINFNGKEHQGVILDVATGKTVKHLPSVSHIGGWTSDGSRFLVATDRFEVVVWKTPEWTMERTITGLQGNARGLAWSPDDQQIAACGDDKTCRVWKIDGDEVAKFDLPSGPTIGRQSALSWRRDGRRIAVSLQATIVMCDLGEPTKPRILNSFNFNSSNFTGCAFSPRTDELAVAQGANGVAVGDPDAGPAPRLNRVILSGQPLIIWSPDGKFLAIGDAPSRLSVWNLHAQSITHEFASRGFLDPLWFDDGQKFLAVSPRTARTWTVEGKQLQAASISAPNPQSLFPKAYSRDGRKVVYQYTHPAQEFAVLDVLAGDTQLVKTAGKCTGAAAFSSDGKHLGILLADNRLQLFDVATWQPLWDRPLPGEKIRKALAWSQDSGTIWAFGGGGMVGLSANDPEHQFVFDDPRLLPAHENDVALASDGKRALVNGHQSNRILSLVDLRTPAIVWSHPWSSAMPALNTDGTLLVCPDGSNPSKRDAASNNILLHRNDWVVPAEFAWSPDSRRLLETGWMGTLRIIDAETLGPLLTIVHLDERRTATFSESGALLFPEPAVDERLVYSIERDDGRTELLSPPEFRRQFLPSVPPSTPATRSGPAPALAVAPFDAAQARAHQEAWAKHLGTQVETTNSVGAKMILIPPGEFLMGSTDEQVEAALKVAEELKESQGVKDRISGGERPQHRVIITKPFLMGATEVTIGQFKKFVAQTGFQTEAEKTIISEQQPQHTYLNPGFSVTDDSAASVITWNDAEAYCQWLSEEEKATYRLPTEAEWEYACRAGTTTQYSFGDDDNELPKYGWQKKNASGKPHPVGTLLPNAFGLFDMHGNLHEWCGDWYDEKWYEKSLSLTTPPNDPIGQSFGSYRVFRGSSWYGNAPDARSAFRYYFAPSARYSGNGFRVVRELDGLVSLTASAPATTGVTATDPAVDLLKVALLTEPTATTAQIEADGSLLLGDDLVPFAYRTPDEYQLDVVIQRLSGNDGVGIGQATPLGIFTVMLTKVRANGINQIDGIPWLDRANPTHSATPLWTDDQPHAVRVRVRRNGVHVEFDGKPFLQFDGELARLQIPRRYVPLPHRQLIWLRGSAGTQFRVKELKLTPLAGRGEPVVVPSTDRDRAAAAAMLRHGATVLVQTGKIKDVRRIAAEADLPAEPFRLININLDSKHSKAAGLTDEALQPLVDLPAVNNLDLDGQAFGDGVADVAARLPQLGYLGLYAAKLTDSGFAKLAACPSLKTLYVGRTPIGDAALRSLAEFRELTALSLKGTDVTEAGLAHLPERPELIRLELSYMKKLTVAGLAHLQRLPNLQTLTIDRNRQLGDEIVEPLSQCRSLKWLSVYETKLTPAGVMRLQASLPKCRIVTTDEPEPPEEIPTGDEETVQLPNEANTVPATAPAKLFLHDPAFPQWMKDVQAMSAEEQIEAVSKKLMELNPGFDGKLLGPNLSGQPVIMGDMVRMVEFRSDKVADLSPVRAFQGLKVFGCLGSDPRANRLFDLTPLQGLPLTKLTITRTRVSDLTPLEGMALVYLYVGNTQVSSLAPLEGMPLNAVHFRETLVSELTDLMLCKNLEGIDARNTHVTAAQVAALQKALPNCKIDWDDPAKATTPTPAASGTK